MASDLYEDPVKRMLAEYHIQRLAEEIVRQTPTYNLSASPHEIARALYLLGWQPPEPADG